jgi:hypothetical protein
MKNILIFLALSLAWPLGALPNPASTYCIKNQGELEIRRSPNGNEYGICKFKTPLQQSECEEWAFFRGKCRKGDCAKWLLENNRSQCKAQ